MLAIDLVSPLPPTRSGISDYSLDLLPDLAAGCDLRLVELPGQEIAPQIRAAYPIVGVDRVGEPGRLPLYQMGNNHLHGEIWRLALAIPGVLTLHDLVLHHFLIERTVKYRDFDGYRAALADDHGWIGDMAGRPIRWPGGVGRSAQFALPAHRTLLLHQRGVLTHSRWAEEQIAEEVPELTQAPSRLFRLAMGVPLPPAADREMGWAFRRRHGIPVDHPLVGAFGFQTPMKRTEMMIEALADPALSEVQLMIAGEVAPIYGLANFAKARGVAERVHFLGYLPFDEFEAAIAAADLCLNLRYPTAGETSASLLRILAVGRVAIVSDYAQSADLPDDLVVKVPVGEDEVPALIAQVGALLADPGRLEAIGRAARTFVATTHAPRDAARAILDACAALVDRERPVARPVFCPPASSLVRSENPSTYTVVGADAPWPAGQRRRLKIRAHNLGAARWLAGEREDGGLALEVQLRVDGVDLRADEPWLPLPIDLEPGQSFDLELSVRRPPGDDVELCVVPHVFGAVEFKNEAHWRSLITRKAI